MKEEDVLKYLQMLGHALQEKQMRGEILLADEVIMLLDIKQPEKRKDMDAYLDYLRGDGPTVERRKNMDTYFAGNDTVIQEAAADIAKRERLAADWLNNALNELLSPPHSQKKWIEFPGLRLYLSPTDYLLAMKVAAGCSQDTKDIKVLAEKLHISNAQDVFSIVTRYVPEQLVTPQMRTLLNEAFRYAGEVGE